MRRLDKVGGDCGRVAASAAQGQTLRMMSLLDAPHYDGQRTTWSPSSDIVNMIQDTLVALDWTGRRRSRILRSPGRSARTARPTPSSCATMCSSAAARRSSPLTCSTASTACPIPRPRPAEMARRQHQGGARARSYYRRIRAERALRRPDGEPRQLHDGDPQPGERQEARQGLRHAGGRRHRSMVLRVRGSRAPRSCRSGTTPTSGGRRCTRTRAR